MIVFFAMVAIVICLVMMGFTIGAVVLVPLMAQEVWIANWKRNMILWFICFFICGLGAAQLVWRSVIVTVAD